MNTAKPRSLRRLGKIEEYLCEAEMAEDARHLLQLYREMVVEEEQCRVRASSLIAGIATAKRKLDDINWDIQKKKLESANAQCELANLNILVGEVAGVRRELDTCRRELHDARQELAALNAQRGLQLLSWDGVVLVAKNNLKALAVNIQNEINRKQRNPRVIIMHPDTFKGMTGEMWVNQVVYISDARVECSMAVVFGQAMLRYS